MIFSAKNFVIFVVGLVPLLQSTLARPLYPLSDDGLVERKDTWFEREFVSIDARSDLLDNSFPELERRASGQVKKEVKANPYTKKGSTKPAAPAKAAPKAAAKQERTPNNVKLTLSKNARKELDTMGLHGKARKNIIKSHKNEMKQHLTANPALKMEAVKGVIRHVATKGRSPKKNYITASFHGKDDNHIPNSFNGGKDHRVYVGNKGLPRKAPVSVKKAPPPADGRKALPNRAKLMLSGNARTELDGMGLHGKARKDTIKWHKKQVKQQMKTNPLLKGKAREGVIEHVAHKGGSDPKEKNHITASFLDKEKKDIPNSFNGGKNHHLYVSDKGLPRQAKAASNKNNADIKGQSKSYQVSVGKTRSEGKSSNKGKGKQNPTKEFSKKNLHRGEQYR